MSHVTIAQASLLELPTLHRMFAHAVLEHFSYFPADVQRRVILDHSMLRLLLAMLDPRRVLLVAKSEGKLIGYAIGAAPKIGPAQLFWLFVDPNFRGHNTGLSLLSRMLRVLGEKGAKVVSIATHEYRSYYERQGFKFIEKTMVDGVEMDILIFKVNRRG